MTQPTLFNSDLLQKYNTNGPRYTSYPTALEFSATADDTFLHQALGDSNNALSLYIHIPFCHSLCYYCGCSKIVTRHTDKADRYLDQLEREMQRYSATTVQKPLAQLHLGGGSPSFLSPAQHQRLLTMITTYFNWSCDTEMSIELDPRHVSPRYLDTLFSLGYKRISFGVQDTDYTVQKAINRVQSTDDIATLVAYAKHLGMHSVNLDLIYGLPHQTAQTFATTLSGATEMQPSRISLFSYAHLPARFAAQRKIKDHWLPSPQQKLKLMEQAITHLRAHGYEMIGMDHFALPGDALTKAKQAGQLHRNFQGYTTGNELDLLGLGVTAISSVNGVYAQNVKTLNDYYAKLESASPVVEKGYISTDDDRIRRDVIMSLMCNLHVDFQPIEARYNIEFTSYFDTELSQLKEFEKDGMLDMTASSVRVFEHSRLFIRIISMTFDAYLQGSANAHRYSRVI